MLFLQLQMALMERFRGSIVNQVLNLSNLDVGSGYSMPLKKKNPDVPLNLLDLIYQNNQL